VDAIVSPTVPAPAFRFGEKAGDPIAMYLSDIFTTPASLAGLPAISVPSGPARGTGLPLGLQIVSERGRDDLVFAAAGAFERETRFTDAVPPIAA
jgi:aspartyl-tRNA(Asn)/glutamyl-tRNA(Gln) amidotransferase subunit A